MSGTRVRWGTPPWMVGKFRHHECQMRLEVRTLMDGIDGARIWFGQGVLAHNLVKISSLLQAKQQRLAACG